MQMSNQVVPSVQKGGITKFVTERVGGSKFQFTTNTWESSIYTYNHILQYEMLHKDWIISNHHPFPH